MPDYWFDHIHLTSPDPIGTAEFYEKMFGANRVGTGEYPDGRIYVQLDLNGMRILVMHPKPQTAGADVSPVGLHHYGLRTDNLEAAVGELKAQGVKFTQEIIGLPTGVKYTFFLSPEDVLVELLERSG